MIAKNAVNIRLISVPPRRFFFQKKLRFKMVGRENIT